MYSIYQAKGQTLEEQYFDVGALFSESICASVKWLAKKWSKQSKIRKAVAEKTLITLRGKPQASEFLRCIEAWADGAKITTEQAMWLMADNLSGCQTMLIRYQSGVGLFHTEEDFDDMSVHMTGEKVVSFDVDGQVSRCLVYNDLMPGAGLYGWKKDLIVAVDTLFLREDGIDEVHSPLLANVIAWMVWRMSPTEASPESILKLVNSLGELIDGYAINVARKIGSSTEGYKITLARTESRVEYLGNEAGDYQRQVNIVDPKYPRMKWASLPRRIWRGGYRHFLERLATIDEHVKKYRYLTKFSLSPDQLESIHTQIQKTIYTDLGASYININVGAVCIGLVDSTQTSVSCKLNDDKPFTELEYLDLV
jgi:hypothetical protein